MEKRKVEEDINTLRIEGSRMQRSSFTGIIRLGTEDNRKEPDKSSPFPLSTFYTYVILFTFIVLRKTSFHFIVKKSAIFRM